jgi:hypothetical protein
LRNLCAIAWPATLIKGVKLPKLNICGNDSGKHPLLLKSTIAGIQEKFMQRLLTLAAACLISGAMAFGQGTVTDQTPTSNNGQNKANTVATNPNGNGTAPVADQGAAQSTPSTPNQALPGNANPANASTSDARANGKVVTPDKAKSGTPGTAAGNAPKTGDNNGMATDDSGNNPASGRGANTITNPGTGGTVQRFWMALGIVIALLLIGVLVSRNRARGNIDQTDPALRATQDRRDARDDQIRRAS